MLIPRYYGAVILVDLFQYSNCYTAQAGITDTAQYSDEEDEGVMDLRDECEAYVCSASGTLRRAFSSLFISEEC